jgi:hypothetical protein
VSLDLPIRGEFRELPGKPPDLEARRHAFRAVLRRLLTTTPPGAKNGERDDEERPDEAA